MLALQIYVWMYVKYSPIRHTECSEKLVAALQTLFVLSAVLLLLLALFVFVLEAATAATTLLSILPLSPPFVFVSVAYCWCLSSPAALKTTRRSKGIARRPKSCFFFLSLLLILHFASLRIYAALAASICSSFCCSSTATLLEFLSFAILLCVFFSCSARECVRVSLSSYALLGVFATAMPMHF